MRYKILAVLCILAGYLAASFGWSQWREWRADREGILRPMPDGLSPEEFARYQQRMKTYIDRAARDPSSN